ncbi:predicted protein [Plenodomus lingam JN3]|uniref:Predicted protein n=1 Tax=Leptosphaeria maculans (strain JN3 / isolate v23.1.3 / race Av1-4-5-6-7-8) TaxID=985895 RepID=E4ZQY2_LEPMJ|nr:predicted protein [Plenodomus lingam JN3]CBX93647.1 predicted protein [Plenodomus lingam JN3]
MVQLRYKTPPVGYPWFIRKVDPHGRPDPQGSEYHVQQCYPRHSEVMHFPASCRKIAWKATIHDPQSEDTHGSGHGSFTDGRKIP